MFFFKKRKFVCTKKCINHIDETLSIINIFYRNLDKIIKSEKSEEIKLTQIKRQFYQESPCIFTKAQKLSSIKRDAEKDINIIKNKKALDKIKEFERKICSKTYDLVNYVIEQKEYRILLRIIDLLHIVAHDDDAFNDLAIAALIDQSCKSFHYIYSYCVKPDDTEFMLKSIEYEKKDILEWIVQNNPNTVSDSINGIIRILCKNYHDNIDIYRRQIKMIMAVTSRHESCNDVFNYIELLNISLDGYYAT